MPFYLVSGYITVFHLKLILTRGKVELPKDTPEGTVKLVN